MSKTLISVLVLYDAHSDVIFSKNNVKATTKLKTGTRDSKINLWLLPLNNNNNSKLNTNLLNPTPVQLQYATNSKYQQKSGSHLQVFQHMSLGAPVVLTLLRIINEN